MVLLVFLPLSKGDSMPSRTNSSWPSAYFSQDLDAPFPSSRTHCPSPAPRESPDSSDCSPAPNRRPIASHFHCRVRPKRIRAGDLTRHDGRDSYEETYRIANEFSALTVGGRQRSTVLCTHRDSIVSKHSLIEHLKAFHDCRTFLGSVQKLGQPENEGRAGKQSGFLLYSSNIHRKISLVSSFYLPFSLYVEAATDA